MRNIKVHIACTVLFTLPAICSAADPAPLSPAEVSTGWKTLFGGSSLRGWDAGKNWEARDGELIRTGKGGGITYVMYRLTENYELRVNWKPNASNSWNTEQIVCHGKNMAHQLNGAPLKNPKASGLDFRGCGEFLAFPDGDDNVTYKGIYFRALTSPGTPPLFEESNGKALIEMRTRLWKQEEAYINSLPNQKKTLPAGASLIERFRAESGYPAPGLKGGQPRLEKIGEDVLANYYRCFIPLTAEMDTYGLYIVPKGLKSPAPLVITQHGNNGFPESALFFGAGNYKVMIRGAISRGYVVYAPHLVTYYAPDSRAGSPIPEDVRQQMDKQLREKGYSLTGIEASRIVKALDVLIERPEIDRNRIAMIGLSLGGSTTLGVTALDPRIKVAVSAGGFRYQALDNPAPLTSSQMIPAIAPRPLQIQSGTRDPLVSIDSARPARSIGTEVYGNAGVKDRFVFEEFNGGHEFNGALAFAFLKKYL